MTQVLGRAALVAQVHSPRSGEQGIQVDALARSVEPDAPEHSTILIDKRTLPASSRSQHPRSLLAHGRLYGYPCVCPQGWLGGNDGGGAPIPRPRRTLIVEGSIPCTNIVT